MIGREFAVTCSINLFLSLKLNEGNVLVSTSRLQNCISDCDAVMLPPAPRGSPDFSEILHTDFNGPDATR